MVRREVGLGVPASSLYYSCQSCPQNALKYLTCHLEVQHKPPAVATAVEGPAGKERPGGQGTLSGFGRKARNGGQETMLTKTSEGCPDCFFENQ